MRLSGQSHYILSLHLYRCYVNVLSPLTCGHFLSNVFLFIDNRSFCVLPTITIMFSRGGSRDTLQIVESVIFM